MKFEYSYKEELATTINGLNVGDYIVVCYDYIEVKIIDHVE